jgi:hypothetical protein
MSELTAREGAVVRRTFGAKRFPKGSPERARLNEHTLTSEYMPSHRYCVGRRGFRTKAEATAHAAAITQNTVKENA